jgi:hypothetical protein
MLQIVMAIIRVCVGLLLACSTMLFTLTGLYFLARQNAHICGGDGIMFLCALSLAAAFAVESWQLLGCTLRPQALA